MKVDILLDALYSRRVVDDCVLEWILDGGPTHFGVGRAS